MSSPIRNRIKGHRRIRAGDLVPHELNPRTHPEAQRAALVALYQQVGFARSLLAYELPDGRLKLIDGHLRRSLEPDMEVDVEVLDLDDDEARALLLSLDPLAGLAGYDAAVLDRLRGTVATGSDALHNLWQTVAVSSDACRARLDETRQREGASRPATLPERFLVLIECADEAEQVRLLDRFRTEGLRCEAKIA
jgi:hypothetical protein